MIAYLLQLFGRRAGAASTVAGAAALVVPAPIESDDEPRYKPIEWPLVRRMLGVLGTYRKQFAWGIGLGLLHVLCELAGPKFIQHIIDFCTAALSDVAHPFSFKIWGLSKIIGLWTAVFVLSVILQRWCIIIMTRAGESVQFEL